MWWRREAPSQLRDAEEAGRKPPCRMPFPINSCWQGGQAPCSPQYEVGSCLRETSLGQEEKRERFPWLSACGMLGRSPTGRLFFLQPVDVKEAAGARDPLQDLVSSQAVGEPDRRNFFPGVS